MCAELFIPPRKPGEYLLPPKSEEEYLKDLEQGADLAKNTEALLALIHIFRAKTIKTGQKYTEEIAGGVIEVFKRLASGPDLSEVAAARLVGEGGNCELTGDYRGAAWFYAGSLAFKVKDPALAFFRLNNLGFCLNFIMKFKEAEIYLRSAAELGPQMYNAWKNLGVSLEHQCRIVEAADCYLKAIIQSRSERRCVKHLLRLVDRNPELRETPTVQKFLQNFPGSRV